MQAAAENIHRLHWVLYTALGALYVLSCYRVAHWQARRGRGLLKWWAITFFLTAIPAIVMLYREKGPARGRGRRGSRARRPARRPAVKCPHCGKEVDAGRNGELPICPHCGMKIDEAHLA